MKKRAGCLIIVFIVLLSYEAPAETYTYPQLVERMTDLQGLAQLPPPGEKTSRHRVTIEGASTTRRPTNILIGTQMRTGAASFARKGMTVF